MDKSELQTAIQIAFADVPYPGDNNIGAKGGRDDAEWVETWLRGKDWRTLASERMLDVGLYFMTPEACHYYLPAYLLGALDLKSQALDGLMFRLGPPNIEDKELEDTYLSFACLLTKEQKKAVTAFLVYELRRLREKRKLLRHMDLGPGYWKANIGEVNNALTYWRRMSRIAVK